MKTAEIRQAFLDFFQERAHQQVESASLIPAGDPTLLFTNAGMVPFKDVFLGAEKRDYTRATSCQKCLRISGKHNDLENVGRTARHHTFFEMLGNFSFGDYFKEEAINFAWSFVTEVLKLPKERLWATVFEDDYEALALWKSQTDIKPERILRYDEKDNFWAMGDTGPCGPCSEIFYYLGDDLDAQSEEEFRKDDGTYVEIWNLVFMQYNRQADGTLKPLPKPSVDTGMGLERVAAVMQGHTANYDADGLRVLIAKAEELSAKTYKGEDYSPADSEQARHDVAFRVIADHARASAFLISDGVLPASDGRGYVLRRLIRRACRHGRELGFTEAFLFKIAAEVVETMQAAYPELAENSEQIKTAVRDEENRFLKTLDKGIKLLEKEVASLSKSSGDKKTLSGEVAFQLHDTYGFPLDMTQDILAGQGLVLDEEGFLAAMQEQKERSRNARAGEEELKLRAAVAPSDTEFVGYDYDEYQSGIVGIYTADGETNSASEGDSVAVVCRQTPFYAESGGQVGDSGTISSSNASAEVLDTQKVAGGTIVHICELRSGTLRQGDSVRLEVDRDRRAKIRANHSATHLLHCALRSVLGEDAIQAGSRVSDKSLRFDFKHGRAPSNAELSKIEKKVNAYLRNNHPVTTTEMSIEEAKAKGAMALFGEKYGKKVRVVEIGPESVELCGGTHAKSSGELGLFTLTGETSVSAGVRRIEAVCAGAAEARRREDSELLAELAEKLRTAKHNLGERVDELIRRNSEAEAQIAAQQAKQAGAAGKELLGKAISLSSGLKLVSAVLPEMAADDLRSIADQLRSQLGDSGIVALGSVKEEKPVMLIALSASASKTHHAGKLMKEIAAIAGSRGGGKADMAQAGGGDPAMFPKAFEKLQELLA